MLRPRAARPIVASMLSDGRPVLAGRLLGGEWRFARAALLAWLAGI